MLGYSESEIEPTADQWKRLLHPDDLAPALAVVESVLRREGEYEMEIRLRHKEGHYIYVLSRGFPVRREAGGPVVRVVGTHFDLAERKAAEEALRQNQERLFSIIDGTTVPLCLVTKGVIEYFNKRFTALFGYTKDDVPTLQEWWKLAYPDEAYRTKVLDTWDADVQKAAAETHSDICSREYQVTCKNGEVRIVEISGVVLDESFLANLFDVTERKQSEQTLRASEASFRALANAVPQIVWICMPDGSAVYYNHQYLAYTGLTLEQGYGAGWNAILHPDDRQGAWKAWACSVATGEEYRFEGRLQASDGSYHWFLMRGVPMRDEAGLILKWFGTCTDIDSIKQAQAQIEALNASLKERAADLIAANKELEAFSYSVSHDLRAPLRAMDGFSRALMKDYADKLDSRGTYYAQRVLAASERMDLLIDGILGLSRLARTNLQRTYVDLSAVAETIAIDLRRANPERQVEFAIAPGLLINADA